MLRMLGTRKKHRRGRPSSGMIAERWITPVDVSFLAVQVREREVNAVGTGCYEQHLRENNVGHHPEAAWRRITSVESQGSKVDGYDQIAFEGSRCDGTATYSIPWEFRVGGGAAKVFATVDQVGTFTRAGRVSITKAGAEVSSDLNDPTERDPRFE